MQIILIIIFLVSAGLILYSYVLFPLLLKLLAAGKKLNPVVWETAELPGISILMSVYNEQAVITAKLKSILGSNYPPGRIEILIGSDNSTDQTDQLIQEAAVHDSRIKYYRFDVRRGKPAIINELVLHARYEILVLTDANVMFESTTLELLIRHFRNDRIGLVGANILNTGMRKEGISIQEKSYIARENLIKFREGLVWGSMMGPFGGCYALRKSLYQPVPPNFLVDDFFICMNVLKNKFSCINELNSVCYEDVSNDIAEEFRRKARISAGNFQNLKVFRNFALHPFTAAGFCFISHKLIRWLTPLLILLSLISLGVLSYHSTYYLLLFGVELIFVLAPMWDWMLKGAGVHLRILRFVSYFIFMNLALIKGFFRYKKGIRDGVWTPTSRNAG